MTKIKKSLMCVLSCLLIFCIGLCFAGCGNKTDEKYDVSLKVKNNLGQEWIFTPDVQELNYEFDYTGEEMEFYIDSYNYVGHPNWGDKWFAPTDNSPDASIKMIEYTSLDGKSLSGNNIVVKEKGSYRFCIETSDVQSDIGKFRYKNLYFNVNVK